MVEWVEIGENKSMFIKNIKTNDETAVYFHCKQDVFQSDEFENGMRTNV